MKSVSHKKDHTKYEVMHIIQRPKYGHCLMNKFFFQIDDIIGYSLSMHHIVLASNFDLEMIDIE